MSQVSVWRLVDRRYSESAFDGTGAAIAGGRFNSPGTRIVYTSDSLSLALLEMLVRVNKRDRLRNHVCIKATFDSALVAEVHIPDLPPDWDSIPPIAETRRLGDAWVESGETLVLRVPSVVVPQQCNYLINPNHPMMTDLTVDEPIPVPIGVPSVTLREAKGFLPRTGGRPR